VRTVQSAGCHAPLGTLHRHQTQHGIAPAGVSQASNAQTALHTCASLQTASCCRSVQGRQHANVSELAQVLRPQLKIRGADLPAPRSPGFLASCCSRSLICWMAATTAGSLTPMSLTGSSSGRPSGNLLAMSCARQQEHTIITHKSTHSTITYGLWAPFASLVH
jgi:hypothetical protein